MRSLMLFFILAVTPSAFALENNITLIAHLSASVNQQLSRKKIKNIYLLKHRSWPDETPVIVVNRRSESPLRQQFERKLGLSSKKYAWYLKKMHYKGIRLPVIQNSRQAVLTFVENVPGAIAYINGSPPNNYPHITTLGQL